MRPCPRRLQVANPLLHNYTMVYVRYCDGAYYSGRRAAPVIVGNQSLHFAGAHITEAVVAELAKSAGLRAATDVVVSGCSAGGIRVYAHLDQIRAMLPAAARVVGASLDTK